MDGVREISVVMPLYNKERHVERAVRSILAQTIQPAEIIVVNDGSTDNSVSVVEKIADPRIRIINQKNAGVSAARNRGIREARFELVAFLDSDDEWKSDFLETIYDLIDRYPEAGAYATAYETIDTDAVLRRVAYRSIPEPPWSGIIPDFFSSMLGQPPVWASAVTIRKKVFDNSGFFKEGEVLAEDVDMWCRIALKYPIAFNTKACAVYHLDADNRCYTRGKINKKATGYIETLTAAKQDQSLPEAVRHNISVLRETVELGYAASLIFGHEAKAARKVLKEFECVHMKKKKLMWQVFSYFPVKVLETMMDIKNR